MPNSNTRPRHVRWGLRRDIPAILDAEAGAESPWGEDDYLTALRDRRVISMVAEGRDERPVGVMVYQLFETHLKLLRLVVHPAHRRQGVGQTLMAKLAYKVCSHRREAIYCRVPESNLTMHLLLRSCAFTAQAVVGSDYLFEFRPLASAWEEFGESPPVNRIETWEKK